MANDREYLTYEQGPIRPPSEAESLLVRVTRNCPWNKCAFCHTYRGRRFELRPVEEIKKDIDTIKTVADELQASAWRRGLGGRITEEAILDVCNKGYRPETVTPLALWLLKGGKTVFLQDADSLIIKTADLVEILSYLKQTFPSVERITSYCRSSTARRKTVADLVALREAGLSRLHVGMESGCDQVLEFITKGASQADHIAAGLKIKEAGISLCEYVMPGLGGKEWSEGHALKTAEALNAIDCDHIRLRSLFIVKDSRLFTLWQEGKFTPLTEEETVKEISLFIEKLENIHSQIKSDHILNLLEEIEGQLPQDKKRLLAIIERFFALSTEDRLIFQLGRRLGYYRRLDDLEYGPLYRQLKDQVARYEKKEPGSLEQDIKRLMQNFI